jgi:fanconi anemia group M protein
LAPTKNLVQQKYESCKKITQLNEKDFILFSGKKKKNKIGSIIKKKRTELWKEKRIFFCTPQIVDNDIKNNICPISSIVLLIIDEAHKSQNNYSFVKVFFFFIINNIIR